MRWLLVVRLRRQAVSPSDDPPTHATSLLQRSPLPPQNAPPRLRTTSATAPPASMATPSGKLKNAAVPCPVPASIDAPRARESGHGAGGEEDAADEVVVSIRLRGGAGVVTP